MSVKMKTHKLSVKRGWSWDKEVKARAHRYINTHPQAYRQTRIHTHTALPSLIRDPVS